MEKDLENRVTTIEVKVNTLEDKLCDLTDIKTCVTELALLSRQQIEHNKKFTETHERLILSNAQFSTTLNSINDNLTAMNEEIKCTNERMINLESKVEEKFVGVNKQINNINEKSKIDLMDIGKRWVPKLLVGGVIFYFLQIAGFISIL